VKTRYWGLAYFKNLKILQYVMTNYDQAVFEMNVYNNIITLFLLQVETLLPGTV
jgi:hypothetical protein